MLLVDPPTQTLAVVSLNYLWDIFGSSSLACNMLDKAVNVSNCVDLIVTATTEGSLHSLFCKEFTLNGKDPAWTVSLEVAINDATKVIFCAESIVWPRRAEPNVEVLRIARGTLRRRFECNRTSWGRDVVRELTLHSNTLITHRCPSNVRRVPPSSARSPVKPHLTPRLLLRSGA